jgi:hypothetical protein
MKLSILAVTAGEPHTPRFLRHFRAVADMLSAEFVVAHDRCEPPSCDADRYVPVQSSGAIEDVLVEAHAACSGDYVLRLDDDETLSPQAILCIAEWLPVEADTRVYAFPRANLWGDQWHAISSGHLFPDVQARMMPRGREHRTRVHEGIAPDALFPGMILHHKFLIKSPDERRAIAARYEAKQAGCGSGHYLQFSVPEDCFDIETFSFFTGRVELP